MLRKIETALQAAQDLMDLQGVNYIGQGETDKGAPCIVVSVERQTSDLRSRIPNYIDGVAVRIEEEPPIGAL